MADVAATLAGWSSTTGSNSPSGGTTISTGLDDNLREIQGVIVRGLSHKGADIASATTTDLGAVEGLAHDITGTTTITGFGTVRAGIWKVIKFEGALTLTHNATSLILPGAANITTAAGDTAIVISEGSGNWCCIVYVRANGSPVAPFVDTNPVVVGSADATKKIRFEVDGLTTGTTRVLTINDADYTIPSPASQADQEAGTSIVTAVTPGRQQFHQSAAKGWCKANINGTAAGSYNVTSVTDNGAGDATITWATDFSDANYSALVTAVLDPAGTQATTLIGQAFATSYAAGTTRITSLRVDTGGGTDASFLNVVAFGDQ